MHILASLVDVPVEAPQDVVKARVRDEVFVGVFGARPGFGDESDEHRMRLDDYWPVRK